MTNPPKKSDDAADFLHDFALAILTWQGVEDALCAAFFCFADPLSHKKAGAIFYAQDFFSAKLRLVRAAAMVELEVAELREWKALARRVSEGALDRNLLAHLPVVPEFAADNSMTLTLGAPIYSPPEIRRKRSSKLDAKWCRSTGSEFDQLKRDIDGFLAGLCVRR